jgi:hypothetical protein
MAQNLKFLRFFQKYARNVLRVMKYIGQIKILAGKNIQGVLDRLENSKNQRKIGFLSFGSDFVFFEARNLTRNDP